MAVVKAPCSYEAARQQRAELLRAIHDFERAVAAPAAGPTWPQRTLQELIVLRDQLAEHIVVTEGPDGLYAELMDHAPRLTRSLSGLVADHAALLSRVDSLAGQLRTATCDVGRARDSAGALLAALSRHRQRGADLVYEAYQTDIGGET